MTPYELRFKIFCQAQDYVLAEYYSKLENQKDINPLAPFPSYEEIEILARKIKNFVVES